METNRGRRKVPAELDRLAKTCGWLAWDGKRIPVLVPHAFRCPEFDHRVLDSACSRAGMKDWCRPLFASDLAGMPGAELEPHERWVLVEILPGGGRARRVLGITVQDPQTN
jgi:hypothetical protein